MDEAHHQKDGMSEDAKTIITVILLIFFSPIGVILMFVWTKWPMWAKLLITFVTLWWVFVFILVFLGLFGLITFGVFTGIDQYNKCEKVCVSAPYREECVKSCRDDLTLGNDPKANTTFTSDTLLIALNLFRLDDRSGSERIVKTDSLCRYAEHLAEVHVETGEVSNDIFERDIADPEIADQYFSGFDRIFIQSLSTQNFLTSDLPLAFRESDATAMDSRITHGCFAIVPTKEPNKVVIQLVGGNLKK
ncbi:hypothetical protein HY408_01075 [Candidatus Gottesmanbacteria bacterium]|nr:hypothetical protein [Candidatus Gottesmanbacteria bacterium]